MPVKPIPDGVHTVTPYLLAESVPQLIDFVKKAFGAQELMRLPRADGSIMHAQVKIGDSLLMLTEPGGIFTLMPTMMYLYVPDADTTYRQALAAGATTMMEMADQFWGDRMGTVRDPLGNIWSIATHQEDVSPDEIARRALAFAPNQGNN